jgi:hypothetical protein
MTARLPAREMLQSSRSDLANNANVLPSSQACRPPHPLNSLSPSTERQARPPLAKKQTPSGRRHVRDSRSQDESDSYIGKIIGPVGLAMIVGSNNYLKPDVPMTQIPSAFVYLGCWFLMAGAVYYFLGIETKGKSIEQIDRELAVTGDAAAPAPSIRQA